MSAGSQIIQKLVCVLAAQSGVPPELPGLVLRGLYTAVFESTSTRNPPQSRLFSSAGVHASVHDLFYEISDNLQPGTGAVSLM